MPAFRRASRERVNAFRVDEQYLLKHYFEGETVFDRLRWYYNNQQYRFEIPESEFDVLETFLAEHGYDLVEIDYSGPYVVAVKAYTAHPEGIFKSCVATRSRSGYNVFLLADREAVEQAIQAGAEQIADTPIQNPF